MDKSTQTTSNALDQGDLLKVVLAVTKVSPETICMIFRQILSLKNPRDFIESFTVNNSVVLTEKDIEDIIRDGNIHKFIDILGSTANIRFCIKQIPDGFVDVLVKARHTMKAEYLILFTRTAFHSLNAILFALLMSTCTGEHLNQIFGFTTKSVSEKIVVDAIINNPLMNQHNLEYLTELLVKYDYSTSVIDALTDNFRRLGSCSLDFFINLHKLAVNDDTKNFILEFCRKEFPEHIINKKSEQTLHTLSFLLKISKNRQK